MKRFLKYVLVVSLMSIAGAAFAADEAQAAAPAPSKKMKREPISLEQRIARMEEKLAAEKAKATPDQEKIIKIEANLEAVKNLQKLEADKKSMLDKDAKADTTAIDQQIKEAKGKLQAMMPKGGIRKGGGHKTQ